MKPNESTVSGYRRFECNSNGNKEGEKKSICIERACRYENAHEHARIYLQCTVVGLLVHRPIYVYRPNKSVVNARERDYIESNKHFVRS